MKPLHIFGIVSLLAAGATGCEGSITAKSAKTFNGTPFDRSADWKPGGSVSIVNVNGDTDVNAVSSGATVSATFKPFSIEGYDEEAEAVAAMENDLIETVEADADGNVTVTVGRVEGSNTGLGAHVDVALPDGFDGALVIDTNNGRTDVDANTTGNATSVKVASDNGECEVFAGSPKSIEVGCDNGDLTATLDGVPADSTGGLFETGNGEITLVLPKGKYSVQAQALAGGEVSVSGADAAECTVDEASAASKTVVCGGATQADPILEAKADGTSLANVSISFQ